MTVTGGTTRAVNEAAALLREAESTGRPCEPVRPLIGSSDTEAAYAVQQRNVRLRLESGRHVVGRKIGLTSPAVQAQLGVDRPDFGYLLDDMDVSGVPMIPYRQLLQPKIEAEIAFTLSADLNEGELSREQVLSSIAHAAGALEIVDSRIRGWDIAFGDTVADNASSGLFVLSRVRVPVSAFDPVQVQVELLRNGEVVSAGNGAACLGDPVAALVWLARTARDFGDPLLAGQVVLSGALGPMVEVAPGDQFLARFTALGEVRATFEPQENRA